MSPPFISISIDDKQLASLTQLLGENKAKRAALSAINKTIAQGSTQLKRRISSTLNISYKEAGRSFTQLRATFDNLAGRIRATNRLIPLIAIKGVRDTTKVRKGQWGARGQGVFVKIFGQGSTINLRHAFKMYARSAKQESRGQGHIGIFSRAKRLPTKGPNVGKGKLTSRGFAGRFAVQEHFAPSVIKLLGEAGTTQMAQEELAKLHVILEKNIASQIDRFLNGKTPDPVAEPVDA